MPKVDDAITTILSAYRIVPIHPHDHHLPGTKWEGHTNIMKISILSPQ
jgi:hypothetical protein